MQTSRRAVGLIAFPLVLVIAGMLVAALHFKKTPMRCGKLSARSVSLILRPDVRQQLNQLTSQVNAQWQAATLRQHRYWLRALTSTELTQQSAFIRLANEGATGTHGDGEIWSGSGELAGRAAGFNGDRA